MCKFKKPSALKFISSQTKIIIAHLLPLVVPYLCRCTVPIRYRHLSTVHLQLPQIDLICVFCTYLHAAEYPYVPGELKYVHFCLKQLRVNLIIDFNSAHHYTGTNNCKSILFKISYQKPLLLLVKRRRSAQDDRISNIPVWPIWPLFTLHICTYIFHLCSRHL